MGERNPRFSPLPEDALVLLRDPSLDGMENDPPNAYRRHERRLTPASRVTTPSLYVKCAHSFDADPNRNARWVNGPGVLESMDIGLGMGFQGLPRPRFEQAGKAPKKLFHFWSTAEGVQFQHFVASPDLVELLRLRAPDAIETIPIDWVFNDGQCLDGYVLLDITRLHYAYDFTRSEVDVRLRHDGSRFATLAHWVALRDDLPHDLGIFRDACRRSDVLVGRALAQEISALASREMKFEDVHTHHHVEIERPRGRRALLAKLKSAEPVAFDESMPLGRKIDLRVLPLLQEGRFAAAEGVLTQWLLARPETPFHAVARLDVTTPPADCARFFDAFATRVPKLAAIYTEMNGFTINPDRWFCDAFGFAEHGGDDGYDWLGDFHACSADAEGSLVITGLEPVQAAFAEWKAGGAKTTDEDTVHLAETLVIVKFQRMLQRARPLMKKVKCPLLASAHDYGRFIVEIPR
jgi:hypothetical protein